MILLNNYGLAKETLDNAYNGEQIKINPEQYKTALWIEKNIPHNSQIYYLGELTYPKTRWMQVLSGSYGHWRQNSLMHDWVTVDYVVVDYSDAYYLRDNDMGYAISVFDNYLTQDHKIRYVCCGNESHSYPVNNLTLIYNQDYIKIYMVVV